MMKFIRSTYSNLILLVGLSTLISSTAACGLVETPLEYEKYWHIVRAVAQLEVDGAPVTIDALIECVPVSVFKGEPLQGGKGLSFVGRPTVFSKQLDGGGVIHMITLGPCFFRPEIIDGDGSRTPIEIRHRPRFELADSAASPKVVESWFSDEYFSAEYARLKIISIEYSIEQFPPPHALLEQARRQDSEMPEYHSPAKRDGRTRTTPWISRAARFLLSFPEDEWSSDPDLAKFAQENQNSTSLSTLSDPLISKLGKLISSRGHKYNRNNMIPVYCESIVCEPIKNRKGYVNSYMLENRKMFMKLKYDNNIYDAPSFTGNAFYDPMRNLYIITQSNIPE